MTSRRQKYRIYHFCLGSVCLDSFLIFFLCMQGQLKTSTFIQTKVHFKNMQFHAVTYDMWVLS